MSEPSPQTRFRAAGLRDRIPPGGIRSALVGGNTVGGWIREAAPRTDGYRHVDTPAMINRLRDLGANHYCFGIWDSPTDFDDLRFEFAPAAQEAGLQLLPYVVPPSETFSWGKASRPYRMDYIAWAEAFARLALDFPVITAWAIDDFDWAENPSVFTPDYLARIRTAQLAINPELGFFTCAYRPAATSDAFMIKYGPYLDGIIFPFLDGGNFNTIRTDQVGADLAAVTETAGRYDVEVILLGYAGRWLAGLLPPTAEYAAGCLGPAVAAASSGQLLGVVAYGLQLDGAPTIANERRSMYGDGRGVLVSGQVPLTAGQYAQLSTPITVQPDSPRHELSFWHSRAFGAEHPPRRGDFEIGVFLDDEQVWTGDVHDATWQQLWVQGHVLQGPVDVSTALRGKTEATLRFRLTALRDLDASSIDVGLDTIETIGFTVPDPGFEDPAAWRIDGTGGPIVAAVDLFEPDRPERIFATVRDLYRAG
ncbi:hypothetical protein [Microlunatus parietis]|uniref:Uncharacterized protein n=1 Tax=Microlunatus parietis TaxID=682979 RepID=A0A7Y9LBZ3_9ACTN|nr:hypothetical protein [Microlunatus parietis]NYE70321.1 hypothetical protein [Microlunatus parietis]